MVNDFLVRQLHHNLCWLDVKLYAFCAAGFPSCCQLLVALQEIADRDVKVDEV